MALALSGAALAEEVSVAQAKFEGWTQTDAAAAGYEPSGPCVSAELVGAPPALGAMGQHNVNMALVDGELDVLNPEVVLTHPETGALTAIEYLVIADEAPTLFGQMFAAGPPDIPGSFALHVWFFDNPNGQFADFNPNISCPAALLPETGGATPIAGLIGLLAGMVLLAPSIAVAGVRMRTTA
jgi:hypothetical protein